MTSTTPPAAPKCTCPMIYDDRSGATVRHALDYACPVHGTKHREPPHCPTCTCGVGSAIVQEWRKMDER